MYIHIKIADFIGLVGRLLFQIPKQRRDVMKTLRFLLLFTMLLFIGVANAQTETTYEYRYALETPVNIRSGQGLNTILKKLSAEWRLILQKSSVFGIFACLTRKQWSTVGAEVFNDKLLLFSVRCVKD